MTLTLEHRRPGADAQWQKQGIVAILLLMGLAGCSAKTETGYEPRRLGDNDAVRRGYYAAPYSPEARRAEATRQQEEADRRPSVR